MLILKRPRCFVLMNIFAWIFKVYNTVLSSGAAILAKCGDLASRQDQQFERIRVEHINQREMLERILAAIEPGPTAEISFQVSMGGQIIEGATEMQLKDSEKFDITLSPIDAKGAPSSIDPTKTTGSTDDTTVATVTMGADGLSGTVTALKPGKTQLQVSVTDANNPDDVVKGSLDIEVLAGDTATIAIGTSAPVAQ